MGPSEPMNTYACSNSDFRRLVSFIDSRSRDRPCQVGFDVVGWNPINQLNHALHSPQQKGAQMDRDLRIVMYTWQLQSNAAGYRCPEPEPRNPTGTLYYKRPLFLITVFNSMTWYHLLLRNTNGQYYLSVSILSSASSGLVPLVRSGTLAPSMAVT